MDALLSSYRQSSILPPNLALQSYGNLSGHNNLNKTGKVKNEIREMLSSTWGAFPIEFTDQHVFNADKLTLALNEERCIGFCSLNIRSVFNIKIYYIEFLVIDKEYQNSGLGSVLFFKTIRSEIMKNLLGLLLGRHIEIFFITPNIRVLSRMSRFASFIYPNPSISDESGSIPEADDGTWKIAREILRMSNNPNRKLERDGLVLHGSYKETPWLIYNNDTAPWHASPSMNNFARKYLGYQTSEDKEFMVRARINLFSIMKFFLHSVSHFLSTKSN